MNNRLTLLFIWMVVTYIQPLQSQTEVTGWGNITGIRVEGEKMAFGTSLRVVEPNGAGFAQTANERVRPRYTRDGHRQTITARLANLSFVETIEDTGSGTATLTLEFRAETEIQMAGAYLCLELPKTDYALGTLELIDPTPPGESIRFDEMNDALTVNAKGLRFVSSQHQLEVRCDSTLDMMIQSEQNHILAYLAVISGNAKAEQTAKKTFTLKATGEIDRTPIQLSLDASNPGRVFKGIGGNFRLQNPVADPPVIQYNLDHLPVHWGRVQMPWRLWHPDEDINPIAAAESGDLHPRVLSAMEMAQTLTKRGIPVMLATWSGPSWAIRQEERRPGIRGNPLVSEKLDRICDSISDYVLYLKNKFGVEAALYSFNESDLGINIRQTGEEHATFIKTLGAALAGKGLATKLLLGDTSDATSLDFIQPAIDDPETHPYIGAVSFHSWRGGSDELLSRWNTAATKLNIPLFIGEGSIDPAAHQYPAILVEPAFAREEIDLYIRICALCQPKAILQWQLTSDYNVLTGGPRREGSTQPLQPTQRFWNLKQLGTTPMGSFALPMTCDRPAVSCAAFGHIASGVYTVHVVNNGATRAVTLNGLPDHVTSMRVYVTNSEHDMDEIDLMSVIEGKAQFTLESGSFTTFISAQ